MLERMPPQFRELHEITMQTDTRDILAHAERWRPWRSYALLRLWNALAATP